MKFRFLYRALRARFRDQRQELAAVLAFVKPGDSVVDIGANKGSYLFWLRRAVGAKGKVFAYEPQPGLAAYLTAICQRMAWRNVSVRECALSDRAGTAQLHVPGEGDSPGASLRTEACQTGLSHSYACKVDTLDAQMKSEGPIAFLKVDVEGYELQVFHGAAQTFRQHRPAVLFECEARHLTEHRVEDVFAFFAGIGYGGWFISPNGLRSVAEFNVEYHQRSGPGRFWEAPGYCNNFLFKPAPLR